MNAQQPSRLFERPETSGLPFVQATIWDRLQQPSVTIPITLLVLTLFYQYLHRSNAPFSAIPHPGELLWDFVVTTTPAWLLLALDDWLNPPLFPVPRDMRPAQPKTYVAKSEALRRILGMDKPGGVMTSVLNTGKRSFSVLSGGALVKRQSDQPPGLGNYDNSCFQNSILQGLASLRPLPAYLAEALEPKTIGKGGSGETLRDLIAQLTDTTNNGTTLWTPKKLKSLDTWQQQDAQEYYSKLLDEIDKEAAKTAKSQPKLQGLESASARDDTEDSQHSDDSGYQSLSASSKTASGSIVLRNPLEGLAAQRVACVQCGWSEGLAMIPFNCLTLNLGIGQAEHDLYERLDAYTHLESIPGVECPKCTLLKVQRLLQIIISRGKDLDSEALQEPKARLEAVELALEEDAFDEQTIRDKCKISNQHRVSSTKTKQVVIARPPQSLAIHMNRSVFDERTGHMFKNLAAVRFPQTLDLGPWCLGSADPSAARGTENQESAASAPNEEQWLSDPRSSMISGDIYPSRITGPIYELRAVVTHQGQHENGHYVCYRKHPYQPPKLEDKHSAHSDEKAPIDDNEDAKDPDDEQTLVDVDITSVPEKDDRWWRLSDESVWEVPEQQVLAQGGVFMLFYDCIDPHSELVSDEGIASPLDSIDALTLNEAEIAQALELGEKRLIENDTQRNGDEQEVAASEQSSPEIAKSDQLAEDGDKVETMPTESADSAIEDVVKDIVQKAVASATVEPAGNEPQPQAVN